MPVSISGDGAVTGVASINTDVSSTELGYLDGVTSAIQPQIAGAGGLVLVGQSSFSAASSVSLDDVFSSTYDNYRIQLGITSASSNAEVRVRYRVSGTDDSSSNYYWQQIYASGTTNSASRLSAQTGGNVCYASSSGGGSAGIDVYRPAKAAPTFAYAPSISLDGSATAIFQYLYAHLHNVSTAYDGITFYPSAGTITGTVRVYGYAQ